MIYHSKPTVGSEELEAINEVIKSGQLANGKYSIELAGMISSQFGGGYAVMTSSGTTALQLALRSILSENLPSEIWNRGILKKPVDIIIPAYVCAAVLHGVNGIGANPVLADVDPNTGNIDPESVKSSITPNTKAIIAAHMFGFPADIEKLKEFNIPIIEDCAQAITANINNKQVGTMGDIAIGSTYATKLICTGHGGFVHSKDRNLIDKINDWLEYDKRDSYDHCYSASMSDLEASMGIVQFNKLSKFIERRREIALQYNNEFKDLFILPSEDKIKSDWFRYVIKNTSEADEVMDKLNNMKIEVKRPVYKPLPKLLGLNPDLYPNTMKFWDESISLPIYPGLTDEEQKKVISVIKEVIK